MSSTAAPWFNDLLIPVMICVAMISIGLLSSPFCECLFLFLVCVCITVAHLHFGITVVHEMADHFNIHVFSLRKKDGSSATTNKVKDKKELLDESIADK